MKKIISALFLATLLLTACKSSKETSSNVKEVVEETAKEVLSQLEKVVTFKDKRGPNYSGTNNLLSKANTRIGAKSGTAEVFLDGRYRNGVISWNIAVAPADDPQVIFYTVLVPS